MWWDVSVILSRKSLNLCNLHGETATVLVAALIVVTTYYTPVKSVKTTRWSSLRTWRSVTCRNRQKVGQRSTDETSKPNLAWTARYWIRVGMKCVASLSTSSLSEMTVWLLVDNQRWRILIETPIHSQATAFFAPFFTASRIKLRILCGSERGVSLPRCCPRGYRTFPSKLTTR